VQDLGQKTHTEKNSPPTPFSFIRVSAYEIASVGELKQTTPKVCEQEMKYIRGRPDIASKVSYFPSGLLAWSRQEEVKK
jgi:hypothetical protein